MRRTLAILVITATALAAPGTSAMAAMPSALGGPTAVKADGQVVKVQRRVGRRGFRRYPRNVVRGPRVFRRGGYVGGRRGLAYGGFYGPGFYPYGYGYYGGGAALAAGIIGLAAGAALAGAASRGYYGGGAPYVEGPVEYQSGVFGPESDVGCYEGAGDRLECPLY